MTNSNQYELRFDAGYTDRFPTFMDAIRHVVYGGKARPKNIAADLDLSQSELSKMISGLENRRFPVQRLDELIEATGDLTPVYWLVEKFCLEDAITDEQLKRALMESLERERQEGEFQRKLAQKLGLLDENDETNNGPELKVAK